ncbi:MAG: addiction module protein [Gammaproteobacteria bacterium]|nr:addiction module protein [Gammaproteobacteria bacterium]
MSIEQFLQQALSMPSADRAWLAHCLIASIEQSPGEAVEQEWLALARQRAEQVRSGQVRAASWEKIRRTIRVEPHGNYALA